MKRQLPSLVAFASAIAVFSSCGGAQESTTKGPCRKDADCQSTEWCDNGVCRPLQSDAGTLGDGPVPQCTGAVASPSAGQNCGCSFDCEVGELCLDEAAFEQPGGQCLRSCSTDACPDGLLCTPLTNGGSVCSIPCKSAADCPQGSLCRPRSPGEPFVCTERCHSDADCPVVGTCDLQTGVCSTKSPSPGLGGIGAPCQSANDCLSGFCFVDFERFPEGYCTSECAPSQQGCPPDAYCVLAIDGGDDYGACFKLCSGPEDCRPGYSCVVGSGVKVCG
ncbi:MAG: hypothetical protein R3B13_12430 [Polyangiaceae bacterium]